VTNAANHVPETRNHRRRPDHLCDVSKRTPLDGLIVEPVFSNRPFRVKRFQTIRSCSVDVTRGFTLLSGIGKCLSKMGSEDEVEQSQSRPAVTRSSPLCQIKTASACTELKVPLKNMSES
jgi:hypothetical protein